MEENRKNKIFKIVIICLAVALVISFFMISNLNNELSNTKNNLNNQISNLREEIDSIYGNVDRKLKKQASLLSESDYTLGEFNSETKKMPVTFTVIPKIVSDNMKLFIAVGDEKIELAKDGEEYSGTAELGLFIEYDEWPLLTIETGGETKTEFLDNIYVSCLYNNVLPQLAADMTETSNYGKGYVRVEAGFAVEDIKASEGSSVKFNSFTLVQEKNGKEIERKDITSEVLKADGSYHSRFTQTFEAAEGDEIKLYVTAEDSLGFIHKVLMSYWYNEADHADEIPAVMTRGESIYDSDGNLLYGEDI